MRNFKVSTRCSYSPFVYNLTRQWGVSLPLPQVMCWTLRLIGHGEYNNHLYFQEHRPHRQMLATTRFTKLEFHEKVGGKVSRNYNFTVLGVHIILFFIPNGYLQLISSTCAQPLNTCMRKELNNFINYCCTTTRELTVVFLITTI